MITIFKSIGMLCILVYSMGIMTNLVPDTYTRKAIKLAVSAYIILSVILSFENFETVLYQEDTGYYSYTEQAVDYVKTEAEEIIEKDISEKLSEKSITYNSVSVHINEESDFLQIDKICVYGVPPERQSSAENIIGLNEKVIFGDKSE